MKRAATDKRLQARINAVQLENTKSTSAVTEMARLQKLFPTEPGSAAFIESLYSAAKESKLVTHDVHTATAAATTRTASRGSTAQSDPISSHRFAISIEGGFRNVAEYIRRIQNFERFKRITDIKLAPGKQGVTGTINLELFSLKEQHAR
jgi:Tfp pilus assembly protein PilO